MIESSRQGAVTVLNTVERFNTEFVKSLQMAIDECLVLGQPMAVINLESTCLINSSALEFLLDTAEKFRRKGGSLKLAAPTTMCAEVLSITELDCELEVYESVNLAVRSFAK